MNWTWFAFRVGGEVVERNFEVGARVREGQVLARLDPEDLAQAADLKRYTGLRAKNFISEAEFDRRASAYATAEARLQVVRAPAVRPASGAAPILAGTP